MIRVRLLLGEGEFCFRDYEDEEVRPPDPGTIEKIYSFLVRECHLKFADIADLTDEQISALCKNPEDKDDDGEGGGMIPLTAQTFQWFYTEVWRKRGKDLNFIRDLWKKEHPDKPWVEPEGSE